MAIKAYRTKSKRLTGTNYGEVHRKTFNLFTQIKKKSKRRVYIRSTYFKKDKIFLSLFWHHLMEKHHKDRLRRLKYFYCAIELIRESRFAGVTADNELFYVQIKENKRNGQKYFISVFPHGK